MDYLPDPDSFLLTRWCSDTSRRVEWLYRSHDGFRFGQVHTWSHGPEFEPDDYGGWADIEDPDFNAFEFVERRSVEAAEAFNRPEVERATRSLQQVRRGQYTESRGARLAAGFYESVLSVFSQWYQSAGLEMPPFPTGEARSQAEINAMKAYPHLHEPTYKDVARAALGVREVRTVTEKAKSERLVDTFLKELRRGRYIPHGEEDIPRERKMGEFRERVKALYERGIRPMQEVI